MNTLEVKNISKTFTLNEKERKERGIKDTKKVAVASVSFEAHEGEIVGLIGPNGAGKTTTMRIISSLIKPDNGDVLFNGQSIFKDMEIKRKIAFMTSDLKLDPKSSANEMFDFFTDLYSIPKETAKKRKAAIAILHDPQFIIFDEPTNGLDVVASRIVREYLLEMKAAGKCIILSTHLFDLAEKVCDKVVMIHNGKVIADDKLSTLTANKNLEDAFYDIYTAENKEVM